MLPWYHIVTDQLGIGFENILLIIMVMAGLLFYAKDVKLGIIMHMVICGVLAMWFYAAGWTYVYALYLFFGFMVIMALTLFGVGGNRSMIT